MAALRALMLKILFLELQVSQSHQSPSLHPLPHPQATSQGNPAAAGPAQDSNRFYHETILVRSLFTLIFIIY